MDKKFFGKIMIGMGIVAGILLVVYILNIKSEKCFEGHQYYNLTDTCYYKNQTCHQDEIPILMDNEYVCSYAPQGFIDSETIKIFWFSLAIGGFIVTVVFIVILSRKKNQGESTTFKLKPPIYANEAMDAFAMYWSQKYGIPIVGENYKKSAFIFYNASEPAQKGVEWFTKFQVEVLEGKYPGVFTVATSINRGVEWIQNGMASWRECLYDDYKRPRDWPIHTVEDPKERMLQMLSDTQPELAAKAQQEMLMKSISEPPPPQPPGQYSDDDIDHIQQPIPIQRKKRRQWPRRQIYVQQ